MTADTDSSPNFFALIDADAKGERLTTTSVRVAVVHGKRHDNVLRLIRARLEELAASDDTEFAALNFEEREFVGPRGKLHPVYLMTQEGYQFIVGKMQGTEAVRHQLAFIRCFREMAALLKKQREGLEYRRAKHEVACKDSERRGSFHGRGLNERKQEIAVLATEEQVLLALSQPQLPGLVVVLERQTEAAPPAEVDAAAAGPKVH